MVEPLVECVPNFSEGKDESIINSITDAMVSIDGVTLLDVDMGADFNRTVVTIVGPPTSVLEAAVAGTRIALNLIDMSKHSGEHARMGAVDVVPFIPISNITMDDCVDLSIRYAERVSSSFDLPIYMYAKAARKPDRVNLPDIRRGEYEGFEDKISDENWTPDYGPAIFNPQWGVTATGARNILVAYNVNLNTNDKSAANRIAGKIRTSGVLVKDENGDKILDEHGKALRLAGKFASLQAAGWMYNEDTAQVSMNLLDYETTGLHTVTEAIRQEADEMGLKTTAGELVGLLPLNAMLDAGRYYHPDGNADHHELVESAISGLQLDALEPFDPKQRIIEWAAGEEL
ncbi:MAG: glutamate formimidoyltransferase [Candidatus Thalassarchaeaceae archaeon]|nr:glutamate formimidoyltransferase [Candidatus Thalassarchaeaceae archaeon]